MKKFSVFILCYLAAPLWAAPSLMDLDSWQLPEEVPAAQTPAPAPAPKPAAPKPKTDPNELKIHLSDKENYAVQSATSDTTGIAVLKSSAKQLLSRLKGKGRFYILFNATTQAAVDKIVTAQDGVKYAFVVFGNEKQNYRILLFKNGIEQPLVDVVEDTKGKLNMYRTYKIDMDFTEEEIQKNYPSIKPQLLQHQTNPDVYHSYQIDGSSLLFQNGRLVKLFPNQQELQEYTRQLGVFSKEDIPAEPAAQEKGVSTPAANGRPTTATKKAKRPFSRIVSSSPYRGTWTKSSSNKRTGPSKSSSRR